MFAVVGCGINIAVVGHVVEDVVAGVVYQGFNAMDFIRCKGKLFRMPDAFVAVNIDVYGDICFVLCIV